MIPVSRIGFGAWAIGGSWGAVDDDASLAALRRALDLGCAFIDTADVYGDGRSERLVGKAKRPGVLVATKAGRRLPKQVVEGYTRENLVAWTDRSRANLGVESLDLLQLHCPPTELYRSGRAFRILDDFVREGRIRRYGVSVETIEEAVLALEHPISSIQIIFNLFRQRPAEELFERAKRRGVEIIARVPLASGLLTGRITPETTFPADDHRTFNRRGEAFDVGETFSGVPLEAAFRAVEALRPLVPPGATMARFALRWILMHEAVTRVIPGGRTAAQVEDNLSSAALPPLDAATMRACREVYDRHLRPHVHARW
jgi:aryl-alcohol dehydrogenase-like predicted oxidoreductase